MPDPKRCPRCQGCGKIANDDDGSPWTAWENLPPGSAAAVKMGIVKPIQCPECGGVGVESPRFIADPVPSPPAVLEVPAPDDEGLARELIAARNAETEADLEVQRAEKTHSEARGRLAKADQALRSGGARVILLRSKQDPTHAVVVVARPGAAPTISSGRVVEYPA